jgi:hypothetical protein
MLHRYSTIDSLYIELTFTQGWQQSYVLLSEVHS